MDSITESSQIQNSIVKLEYKGSIGTGFFISSNIIITAFHTFFEDDIESTEISILQETNSISGEILSYDKDLDICLIRTNEASENHLKIWAVGIRVNEKWETFGFPGQSEERASKFFGTISHRESGERYDFVLNSEQVDINYDYSGLSGSPVVCNGRVIGIILKQIENKLGAISINQIKDYLSIDNIEFEIEENSTNLPSQFNEEIRRSVSNNDVLDKLEESVLNEGNWILMTGSPGSGKSLNIASFKPYEKTISITGKYFIKIPNDDKPKSLRTSKNFFLKWLEESIIFTIQGTKFPKEDKSFEERVERLPGLFQDLSDYYSEKGATGVICIDGLDEIQDLIEFLGIINFLLPNNIKIILSCTSKEILPSDIKNYLRPEQTIEVTPIKRTQCEYFIFKEIGRDNLDIESVQKLALKSEGHPLYLRYLTNIVKDNIKLNQDKDHFEDWLDSIPAIEGDIENYYSSIWDNIYEDKNKLWISLSIAQLRSPLDKENVILTLPEGVKNSFYSSFPSIKYLFTEKKGKIEIFHNSFREFVNNQAEFFIKDCNDNIIAFCESNIENEYSIGNSLHHYGLSNTPEMALSNCNQEWADKLAINHIEPDLVLLDIKNAINLSIKLNQTTELIRLLLLLQRIEFRYDYVFYEYAENIALALIANGKYKHALKYIVRSNILLVSNDKAITFLQLFYEAEADEQANLLLDAIDARFRKEIESNLKPGKGISMDFLTMKSNSIILSAREDPKKIMRYSQFLQSLESNEEVGENKTSSGVSLIREAFTAWHQAYLMRAYNIHVDPIKVSEFSGNALNNRWAKMIALSKYIYDNELKQYNTNYYEENDDHIKIIKDIEYLISNHGYINDKPEIILLIKSLLNESNEFSLVEGLIENYFNFPSTEYNLRENNGVDFDIVGYINIEFESKCKGYIDKDNIFPEIHHRWGENGWELYLNSLIININFIEGKAQNFKARNYVEGFELIKENLRLTREALNFSFEERSHWNRSYQLPEEILPLIYQKLIHLYYHFNQNELDSFLEEIIEKAPFQLALYSEGYRKVLFEITKVLLLKNHEAEKIESIVQLWEEHILNGVQNRWERTEELLKICEVYALLRNDSKYDHVFQQVLNTSMGPTWYKEAQLDLLNSTLSNLPGDSAYINTYIRDYAALLDYASGEMTFQRYVRYEKEDFVRSLIANNRLNFAIKYFKQEILPPPKLLIENAEQNTFDAPTLGNGYNLGARNFIEQSAILKILYTIQNTSPYLRWALCRIFTINDDNFRYISGYGENISNVLNEIENLNESNLEKISEDLSNIIADEKLNNDDRRTLLNELHSGLTDSNIELLKSHLSKHGIVWGSNNEENDEVHKSTEPKKVSEFEKFNNSINTPDIDRSILIESGISCFEKERVSIWHNNWSGEHSKSKENLKKLLQTDHEVTDILSREILSFDENPWNVSKEMIWFLDDKISNDQIEEIYGIVNNHFHYIIRPSNNSKEKYSWLLSEEESINSNSQIIDFIIWLLNHPFLDVRKKTFDALVDLSVHMGKEVILKLINSATSEIPELSTKTSSYVLSKISEVNPQIIRDVLTQDVVLIEKIKTVSHFTIKYNFITIAENLKIIGFQELLTAINQSIPDTFTKTGEVFLDEDFLFSIRATLEELNDEELLNREFCESLILKTKEYCSPLEIFDVEKSDKYLKRSFYNETQYFGRFEDILNHALNVAINNSVDKNNIKVIHKILN